MSVLHFHLVWLPPGGRKSVQKKLVSRCFFPVSGGWTRLTSSNLQLLSAVCMFCTEAECVSSSARLETTFCLEPTSSSCTLLWTGLVPTTGEMKEGYKTNICDTSSSNTCLLIYNNTLLICIQLQCNRKTGKLLILPWPLLQVTLLPPLLHVVLLSLPVS